MLSGALLWLVNPSHMTCATVKCMHFAPKNWANLSIILIRAKFNYSTCKPLSLSIITHLFLFQHVWLSQYLHSIHMSRVELLYEGHLTESTAANDLQAFKVFLPQPWATKAEKLGLLLSMLLAMSIALKIVTNTNLWIAAHSLIYTIQRILVKSQLSKAHNMDQWYNESLTDTH